MICPLNLRVMVFGFAAIYSQENAALVDVPTWMNNVTLIAGIVVVIAGAIGYYGNLKNDRRILRLYKFFLAAIIIFMIIAAIGYFFISMKINDIVDNGWPEIYQKLLINGYNVNKKVFIDYVTMNLKFAGIYGLMYSFFLVITFFATLHKLNDIF